MTSTESRTNMTIINGQLLLEQAPIKNMLKTKERAHGVSYGLAEAGYDIRIKQEIRFGPGRSEMLAFRMDPETYVIEEFKGRFVIASSMEEFQMPEDLVGVVHDKSTWARRGLSVFNTVLEPGWEGFLTIELVYHGHKPLCIPAGAGIAQVLFTQIASKAAYRGKYQNQQDRPVEAIYEKG